MDATLKALIANGYRNSLQARLLSDGGRMRVFDIDLATSSSVLMQQFYTDLIADNLYLNTYCLNKPRVTNLI